jgi:hypothetical protein
LERCGSKKKKKKFVSAMKTQILDQLWESLFQAGLVKEVNHDKGLLININKIYFFFFCLVVYLLAKTS